MGIGVGVGKDNVEVGFRFMILPPICKAGYFYPSGVYEVNHLRSLFFLHFYMPSQSYLPQTFPFCASHLFLPCLLSSFSSASVSWPLLLCPFYHPEHGDRDFNGLLSSLVQLLSAPEARTLLGFQSLVQREWVAAGHPFLTRLGGAGASEEVRMFWEVLGVLLKEYGDEILLYNSLVVNQVRRGLKVKLTSKGNSVD